MYLFNIVLHYSLSQDVEYSSLCYAVGPCLFQKAEIDKVGEKTIIQLHTT